MAPAESKRSILLITNDLGPHAGGIETFLLGLIDQLDGKDIVIYTSREEGFEEFDKNLEKSTGVKVIRDKSSLLIPTPRITKKAIAIAKEFQSEVAWFGAAAPLAMMAKNLKKAGVKRTIAISHGHEVWWAKVPLFRQAMRRIGNGCDVVTYLGAFTRDSIKGALGNKTELIHIAPGISINHFKPGEKPSDLVTKFGLAGRPTIVCVGRLVKRKGQDKLIEALPLIREEIPNVKLVYVGEGKLKRHLIKRAEKLGLTECVIFAGRVSYKELPKYFLLGDVFAMPSRSRNFGLEVEGLGIVYLEASASGIPVLGGASGGAPDAVLVGETGFVADGRDRRDIAKHLINILSNLERAKAMGEAGRKWAESDWSWELWGARFKDVLEG
jgi:phosphatidylinositol alpha-1,6-mannosyltransferase